MIRIVDRNDKYIVQKVISQSVVDINEIRAKITEKFLRYQVVPVNGIGDASLIREFETLTEARKEIA